MYDSENYFPRNEEELCGLIAQARSEGLPLEVCGNRTKRFIGRPLEKGLKEGARLSVRQMTGVTLYEPQELVISARAGTPLSKIEAVLDEHNQELAFEPCRLENLFQQGEDAEATLGGAIAANASGPRRILRGAARDYVLGARAVNGKGETFKSGGRVMKNVTGYDIARALAGSWGTLAVMSEITLKVLPKAEETRTLVFLNLPNAAAVSAMCTAMGTPYEVSATVHLPQEFVARHSDPDIAGLEQSITALRLESYSSSLEYRTGRLHRQLKPYGAIYELDDARSRAFWDDIRALSFLSEKTDEDVYLTPNTWPLWRVTVAPHQAARLMNALTTQLKGCRAAYEWSGGLIWVEVPPATDASATMLRRIIAEFQADALLVRAEPETVAEVDVFQPLAEGNMRLIKGLKEAFDPHRILGPGRMYAGV